MLCTRSKLHRDAPVREVAMPGLATAPVTKWLTFVHNALSDLVTVAEVCACQLDATTFRRNCKLDCCPLRPRRPAYQRGSENAPQRALLSNDANDLQPSLGKLRPSRRGQPRVPEAERVTPRRVHLDLGRDTHLA
jgi:hypothetical protein